MKKIAKIHVFIMISTFFLAVMSKIFQIDFLNMFKVLGPLYFFVGNFFYWILFKKIKGNLLIIKSTPGIENQLYYISSVTNWFLYYVIIKVIFRININIIFFIIIMIFIEILFYKKREK